MQRPLPISCPTRLFADFRWTFLCPRREIEPAPPKTLSVQFQAPPELIFTCFLSIPLLSELCKPFLSACTLNVVSQAPPDSGASMKKPMPHEHTNALRGRGLQGRWPRLLCCLERFGPGSEVHVLSKRFSSFRKSL